MAMSLDNFFLMYFFNVRSMHTGIVLLDPVVQVIFDSIGSIAISAETRSVLGKTYARK